MYETKYIQTKVWLIKEWTREQTLHGTNPDFWVSLTFKWHGPKEAALQQVQDYIDSEIRHLLNYINYLFPQTVEEEKSH